MLLIAAAAMAAASAAWACVPQPRLIAVLPQASGPTGTQVTVQGVGFDPPPARIEIRWNAVDGPELGRAENADFSVPVVIPDAPPGMYGLLVMSRGADGVLGNTGRATFEVTGPGRAPTVVTSGAAAGPTFAPARTSESSGVSWLVIALGAGAILALGVFLGTFLRARA